MNKVIVVGANGFIGSSLAVRLASERVKVVALVDRDFKYDFIQGIDNITCIEFSLDNMTKLYDDERLADVDFVYNMAWAGVNANYRNEAEVQAQNVMYGLYVLEFAKHQGIKRVLFPGSAAEVSYTNGAITGKEIPSPADMYSASKVATRYLCMTYAKQNNIDLIWTLITSIYGPKRNDNNLITYAIKSLLKGERPSFTGLEQQWDYLYVDDLINALIALGNSGIGGKVYPVGSGEHKQMIEYIMMIKDIINPKAELGIGDIPYKNGKIDNQIMDISELNKDTGFVTEYSFMDGIRNVIAELSR